MPYFCSNQITKAAASNDAFMAADTPDDARTLIPQAMQALLPDVKKIDCGTVVPIISLSSNPACTGLKVPTDNCIAPGIQGSM